METGAMGNRADAVADTLTVDVGRPCRRLVLDPAGDARLGEIRFQEWLRQASV
jgi:hypothetical protein